MTTEAKDSHNLCDHASTREHVKRPIKDTINRKLGDFIDQADILSIVNRYHLFQLLSFAGAAEIGLRYIGHGNIVQTLVEIIPVLGLYASGHNLSQIENSSHLNRIGLAVEVNAVTAGVSTGMFLIQIPLSAANHDLFQTTAAVGAASLGVSSISSYYLNKGLYPKV